MKFVDVKEKQINDLKAELALVKQKVEGESDIDVTAVTALMKKWQDRMPLDITSTSLQSCNCPVNYINLYAMWGAEFITPTWDAKSSKAVKNVNIELEELFLIVKVCCIMC